MRHSTVAALLLLGLAAAVPGTAAAQHVGGGVKGGLTFSTVPEIGQALDFDSSTEDHRAGVTAGLFIEFEATGWFAIQPELLYVQKGVDVSPTADQIVRQRLEVDYIEIPVLAKLTGGPDAFNVYVFGGPTFGIRIDSEIVTEFATTTLTRDASEEIKGTDVGFAVGGGVKFSFLLIEARLTQGVTAINKAGAGLSQDVSNRTFSIMGGITF